MIILPQPQTLGEPARRLHDCRLHRNQNYAFKLRRKRRDKQTSALISINIILILMIIISIIFIRNSIRCSDVRTVQGRVDCGWRKCC